MSEPTRDPFEALKTFGTGGVPVNPLDPAAVRRLGDQRRRRQNTMYGVIAAVVVAAAVIPTALIATHGDADSGPSISHTPSPDPTPTQSPTSTPTVIAFPNGGVAIKAPEDTDQLVGTTEAFKTFIKGVWQKDHDDGNDDDRQHDQGGHRPADTEAFTAARQRIEQIGERHAGDERHQHGAEKPQQRDEYGERRHPERDLPLQGQHDASHCRFGRLAHQGPASAEFMCPTHLAR